MDLKKYLPIENFTLTTNLTFEEINKRLENCIEEKKKTIFSFSSRDSVKPYKGFIKNNSFVITRVINYRNSFLPIISGEIIYTNENPTIKIKMGLPKFIKFFVAFWLGIVGIACLFTLLIGVLSINNILKHGFSPFALIPFGLFVFGFSLIYFCFKYESKISKTFLIDLLKGKIA
ncbi:MAG: hypothetical protein HYR91_09845 [Flavobacteriia bacterium]|nr:hypothetical protein [Flavobacteriia bacterium]